MHNVASLLLHFILRVYKSVQDWILFSYAWLDFPDLCLRLSAEKGPVTRQHKKTSVPKRKGKKRNKNKRERYTNWQKIKTASSEPSQPTIQHFLRTTLSHTPTLSLHNSFPQSNTFSVQLFPTIQHFFCTTLSNIWTSSISLTFISRPLVSKGSKRAATVATRHITPYREMAR